MILAPPYSLPVRPSAASIRSANDEIAMRLNEDVETSVTAVRHPAASCKTRARSFDDDHCTSVTRDAIVEALVDLFWSDPKIDRAQVHACLVRHYEKELSLVHG